MHCLCTSQKLLMFFHCIYCLLELASFSLYPRSIIFFFLMNLHWFCMSKDSKITGQQEKQRIYTHHSRGSLVPFWRAARPAGVGLNLAQIAKDFSLTGSGYCPPWARGWVCVMCEMVSALPIHPSLWALSSFGEGNDWRSWVQRVIFQTLVNYGWLLDVKIWI